MYKIIIILLGTIIASIAVKMIYDARDIAKNVFSKNETNEITKILKIVGFIILIISVFIIRNVLNK